MMMKKFLPRLLLLIFFAGFMSCKVLQDHNAGTGSPATARWEIRAHLAGIPGEPFFLPFCAYGSLSHAPVNSRARDGEDMLLYYEVNNLKELEELKRELLQSGEISWLDVKRKN